MMATTAVAARNNRKKGIDLKRRFPCEEWNGDLHSISRRGIFFVCRICYYITVTRLTLTPFSPATRTI